jgi:PDZ domain-containing protein
LIPAFPLDGGRFFRTVIRGLVPYPATATRRGRLFGLVLAAALAGWGIFLVLQHSRFSWETGLITFLFVLLIVDGVRPPSAKEPVESVSPERGISYRLIHGLEAGLLCMVLLATACGLLLTNNVLDAPGVALSVGPMIKIPDQYRHPITGQFFLVTVISQVPITAGEWVLGHIDPAIQIVPPENVTPKNTTPQQQARQDYQMLDDSETTAIAVGLRLAGYTTALVGKGVQVDSILPGSHANGLLQVGDMITSINGKPVQTSNDLINLVSAQNSLDPVHLQIKRG